MERYHKRIIQGRDFHSTVNEETLHDEAEIKERRKILGAIIYKI